MVVTRYEVLVRKKGRKKYQRLAGRPTFGEKGFAKTKATYGR